MDLHYAASFDDGQSIITVNSVHVSTFYVVSLGDELRDLLQKVIGLGDEVFLLYNGRCIEDFMGPVWFE
jgi:hypothetical protein